MGWQSGVRSCIMPRLPAHLVQELNVVSVPSRSQVLILQAPCSDCYVQCRHFITALNARAPGFNTRPHARSPPSFPGMDAWMSSQLNLLCFASYVGYWCVWLVFFIWVAFDMLSHGSFYNQVLKTSRRLVQELNACSVKQLPY